MIQPAHDPGATLIVHRTVSRFRAAVLLHPSIASRLTVTILSAPTIARNAVGLTLCIIRCPASQRGKSSVRAAMRSGHCQLAGAISRATRPGTIAQGPWPLLLFAYYVDLILLPALLVLAKLRAPARFAWLSVRHQ